VSRPRLSIVPQPRLLGFGGHPLEGDRLVRIAYLDEAGISNPAHEPYLVVAGIIMHADEHWRPIEEHFRAIARRYLPEEPRPIFHAMEIFHGTGKFDRKKWPRSRRIHLLAELCEIPGKFGLPVVAGFHQRQRHRDDILKQYPDSTEAQIQTITHADTFFKAAITIEGWMRRVTRNETVMLIAEDVKKMKSALKVLHSGYTDRYAEVGIDGKTFHSTRIIETVHFAAKAESMPLQIADACAFVIKRHLMDKEDADGYYDLLSPHIVRYDDDYGIIGPTDDGNEHVLMGTQHKAI